MEWILNNKEWLFSGIGVLILTILYKLFYKKEHSNDYSETNTNSNINTNTNSNSNVVNVNLGTERDSKSLESDMDENDVIAKKRYIKILFIDDDTKFKIIKILNNIGWETKIVSDIDNLDSRQVLETHLFFVDINGVGKKLFFKDEGLGLANAIKSKYPEKKVVIYSSNPDGNRFHSALRNVDDFLNKNAEPIEFQGVIEQLTSGISKQ